MIARAAEILHHGIDFRARVERLLLRLDLGIQGAAVDLAKRSGRALERGDYRRLTDARMTTREALTAADDNALLLLLGNEREKLAAVRDAVGRWRIVPPPAPPAPLPVYQQ
jgi:hypothetical protein